MNFSSIPDSHDAFQTYSRPFWCLSGLFQSFVMGSRHIPHIPDIYDEFQTCSRLFDNFQIYSRFWWCLPDHFQSYFSALWWVSDVFKNFVMRSRHFPDISDEFQTSHLALYCFQDFVGKKFLSSTILFPGSFIPFIILLFFPLSLFAVHILHYYKKKHPYCSYFFMYVFFFHLFQTLSRLPLKFSLMFSPSSIQRSKTPPSLSRGSAPPSSSPPFQILIHFPFQLPGWFLSSSSPCSLVPSICIFQFPVSSRCSVPLPLPDLIQVLLFRLPGYFSMRPGSLLFVWFYVFLFHFP